MPGFRIGENDNEALIISEFIKRQEAHNSFLNVTGSDKMLDNLDMNQKSILNCTLDGGKLKFCKATTDIDMNSNRLFNAPLPINADHACNKLCVDEKKGYFIEVRHLPRWKKPGGLVYIDNISLSPIVDLSDKSQEECDSILKNRLHVEVYAKGNYHTDSIDSTIIGTYPLKSVIKLTQIGRETKYLFVKLLFEKEYTPNEYLTFLVGDVTIYIKVYLLRDQNTDDLLSIQNVEDDGGTINTIRSNLNKSHFYKKLTDLSTYKNRITLSDINVDTVPENFKVLVYHNVKGTHVLCSSLISETLNEDRNKVTIVIDVFAMAYLTELYSNYVQFLSARENFTTSRSNALRTLGNGVLNNPLLDIEIYGYILVVPIDKIQDNLNVVADPLSPGDPNPNDTVQDSTLEIEDIVEENQTS